MEVNVRGQKLNYTQNGAGWPVLFLHGWGCSTETFAPVAQHLAKDFLVYNLDLPGFGKSAEPPVPWGSAEYAQLVEAFIKELAIKDLIIIAHSFGGRLALHLAAKNIPKKLILTGSAGLKPKRGVDYYLKVYSYKTAKKVLGLPGLKNNSEAVLEHWRKKSGSADYQQASNTMRQTLVRVVNEDLANFLPLVQVPTLLFWGENDTATPLADAKVFEKNIPDAGLVVAKGAGHYAYLEQLPFFLAVIDSFLQPERGAKHE